MSDENRRRVFDIARACFWLIAFVIGSQVFFTFVIVALCGYGVLSGSIPAGTCKEAGGQISDMLIGALAAALAFGGTKIIPKE